MTSNYELVGFPAIPGKILILGNSVAFGSMEKGFFYVDDGNDFWQILDMAFYPGKSVFEKLRVDFKKGNEQERVAIKQRFIELLNANDIGLSDVISKCINETRSKDPTIKKETIEYNNQLPSLIDNCEVIIINGYTDTYSNFRKALNKYSIDISSKKLFVVGSSANYRGMTNEKRGLRGLEWAKALCWYRENKK